MIFWFMWLLQNSLLYSYRLFDYMEKKQTATFFINWIQFMWHQCASTNTHDKDQQPCILSIWSSTHILPSNLQIPDAGLLSITAVPMRAAGCRVFCTLCLSWNSLPAENREEIVQISVKGLEPIHFSLLMIL